MLFTVLQSLIIFSFCSDESSKFSDVFLAESFARDDLAIAVVNILKKNESSSYLYAANYNYNTYFNYEYNAESIGSSSESETEVFTENAGYTLLKQAIYGLKVDKFSQIQVAGGIFLELTFFYIFYL